MRFIIFCFLASASLQAASFVAVTCDSPLGDPIIYTDTGNGSGCYADTSSSPSWPPRGAVSASGSVTLALTTDPAQFNNLWTNQSVSNQRASNPSSATGDGPSGYGQVTIHYATGIMTEGPVRAGYLQISNNSGSTLGFGYDGALGGMTSGLSIDPDPYHFLTTSAQYCSAGSSSACTPGPTYFGSIRPVIPVTLGTTVTLFANGKAQTFSDSTSGSSLAILTTQFQFRFLEADGLTPVLASETPEPTSVALLTVGFLGISAASLWKKRA